MNMFKMDKRHGIKFSASRLYICLYVRIFCAVFGGTRYVFMEYSIFFHRLLLVNESARNLNTSSILCGMCRRVVIHGI